MKRDLLSITDVITDPNLLGKTFSEDSWEIWRIFLKVLFGRQLSEVEAAVFRFFTKNKTLPEQISEAWVVAGRRVGKSLVSALVAIFIACFREYGSVLAPGERATVMVIAADRRQAKVVFRYIVGLLEACPMLTSLMVRQTAESMELANRATIEVHTASFRTTRGYTIAAAVCDEIAFWRIEDSANPDTEILAALRPGMATIPGSLLLCISSPQHPTIFFSVILVIGIPEFAPFGGTLPESIRQGEDQTNLRFQSVIWKMAVSSKTVFEPGRAIAPPT